MTGCIARTGAECLNPTVCDARKACAWTLGTAPLTGGARASDPQAKRRLTFVLAFLARAAPSVRPETRRGDVAELVSAAYQAWDDVRSREGTLASGIQSLARSAGEDFPD